MKPRMDRKAADDIAIRALGFLASEPERMEGFLSLTGLGPDTIRAAAREPHFLASVLDHVCADESLLLGLADQLALRPETVAAAQALLAGPPPSDP